jgi:hypothetical protein
VIRLRDQRPCYALSKVGAPASAEAEGGLAEQGWGRVGWNRLSGRGGPAVTPGKSPLVFEEDRLCIWQFALEQSPVNLHQSIVLLIDVVVLLDVLPALSTHLRPEFRMLNQVLQFFRQRVHVPFGNQ